MKYINKAAVLAAGVGMCFFSAHAQEVTVAKENSIANETVTQAVQRLLPASTMISVTPNEEITSKKIEVGTKVAFSVVNDVAENGSVAIPRGSQVTGTITFKTGKAIGGKSGKFEVNFDSINIRGRNYALRGVHRQEGKGNTAAALLGSILVSGRSAQMLPGQIATAFTVDQIPY